MNDEAEITHISLFTGIGGMDLAAEAAGFETILMVEWDKYCQKVLKKHWPDVPIIGDIKDVTRETLAIAQDKRVIRRERKPGNDDVKSESRGDNDGRSGSDNGSEGNRNAAAADNSPITLITGGFPCQPVSHAGKRKGKDDDRWLWPEMLRVISEVRPTWVVAENVAGLLNMGLDGVLSDLESIGYEVQTFLIPACGVDAPHRRNRIFIVAYSTQRQNHGRERGNLEGAPGEGRCGYPTADVGSKDVADTEGIRPGYGNNDNVKILRSAKESGESGGEISTGRETMANTASRSRQRSSSRCHVGRLQGEVLREGGDSDHWPIEPKVGRVANGVPNRVDRLKCLGNAVVPAQVFPILKAIADIERGQAIPLA